MTGAALNCTNLLSSIVVFIYLIKALLMKNKAIKMKIITAGLTMEVKIRAPAKSNPVLRKKLIIQGILKSS